VISPPHIPSFEVSLKRANLYNALAEMNVMYQVVLLHRLTAELLSPYKMLVIPNIPYMDADQIAAIRTYKERGGKIYTIGSSRELRELASLQSPASMLDDAHNEPGRRQLLAKINQLAGEQVITVPGTQYVAANVVKKMDSDRIILHFVNYHTPINSVHVSVNLDGVVPRVDGKRIQLFSPDGNVAELEAASVRGTRVEFVLPKLDVYDVVTIN